MGLYSNYSLFNAVPQDHNPLSIYFALEEQFKLRKSQVYSDFIEDTRDLQARDILDQLRGWEFLPMYVPVHQK